MELLVELTTFYPIVERHGLSKWWIYKQLSKLSYGLKRGVLPSGRSTSSSLVPYEEMMHLILCASKKKNIKTIIHLAWTVIYGRRMTHIASHSHGNWQRHYSIQRNKGRIAIATPEDFFALCPTFLFFKDNIAELEMVMAPSHYYDLVHYLDSTERKAQRYISNLSKSRTVQQKLANLDYEQFYHLMLDAMIYGTSEELAFTQALKDTPKRSDKGSSKEFITSTEGAIESFAEPGVSEAHVPFKMDFEKLRRSFGELLLKERLTNIKNKKGRLTEVDEKTACSLAADDMAILDFVIDGCTDAEIVDRLGLTCTRQAMTMRRAHIMDMAKEHFQVMND